MKKLVLLSILLLSLSNADAQEVTETKIKSKIQDVTIFITGGEILRTANVNLKKGRNKLIFTRISTVADHKSVQFTADKKFNLVSVRAEVDYISFIESNQIIVIVDSEIDQTLKAELKYIVSNCGWQSNYDLSAADVKEKINLKYRAKVYNNTGNDWEDVHIVLSTSDPNLSASAPVLSPWYLNYASLAQQTNDYYKGNQYVVPQKNEFKQYYQNASAPEMSGNLSGLLFSGDDNNWKINEPGSFNPKLNFTTIKVSELSTEFIIEEKYAIPSDSKPYLVEVTDNELNATFSHKAVPKLNKDAFLLANIVGWEKLDLVPGPTHVYFGDTYVGQSYINTHNVGDTPRLSFGRDSRILIARKKLEEYSDKKVVGSNRKDTYLYEIAVKNNRDIPVTIDLFDQIPISQDSDISVLVDEISSADRNETNGLLNWKVHLEP